MFEELDHWPLASVEPWEHCRARRWAFEFCFLKSRCTTVSMLHALGAMLLCNHSLLFRLISLIVNSTVFSLLRSLELI